MYQYPGPFACTSSIASLSPSSQLSTHKGSGVFVTVAVLVAVAVTVGVDVFVASGSTVSVSVAVYVAVDTSLGAIGTVFFLLHPTAKTAASAAITASKIINFFILPSTSLKF